MQHDIRTDQRRRTQELIAPGRQPGDAPIDEWAALATLLIRSGMPYGQACTEAERRLIQRRRNRRALLIASIMAIVLLALLI